MRVLLQALEVVPGDTFALGDLGLPSLLSEREGDRETETEGERAREMEGETGTEGGRQRDGETDRDRGRERQRQRERARGGRPPFRSGTHSEASGWGSPSSAPLHLLPPGSCPQDRAVWRSQQPGQYLPGQFPAPAGSRHAANRKAFSPECPSCRLSPGCVWGQSDLGGEGSGGSRPRSLRKTLT